MSLYAAREKKHELDERTRLLYVAFTRAADYLILSSSLPSDDEPCSDWMNLLAKRFDLRTGQLRGGLPENLNTPMVYVGEESESNETHAPSSRGPDLLEALDAAHRLAAEGPRPIPTEVVPVAVDKSARRQYSFSSLTGQLIRTAPNDDREGTSAPPSFLPPLSTDARTFGTLVHDLLARIDLGDASSIADWSEHLAATLVMEDEADAARAAAGLASRFASSPRGREMAGSTHIQREVEFILAWPPGRTDGDGTYLRGFIDCLYEDTAGRLILVDYKTDNVAAGDVSRVADRYAMQLYVYAIAMERAVGRSPDEIVVHFLRPGVERIFAWNDEMRREAIASLDQAIAATKRCELGPVES
jgi:ATP-dependent helicase/nuclease subunit A